MIYCCIDVLEAWFNGRQRGRLRRLSEFWERTFLNFLQGKLWGTVLGVSAENKNW